MNNNQHSLSSSRRGFFRQAAAGAAGMAFGGLSLARSSAAARARGVEKSRVELRTGKDRREMIFQALKPFAEEVSRAIGDKQVVIKANAGLAAPKYARCSSHADQLRGILDFLKEMGYDRQVIITEGTAGAMCDAFIGFENYGYLPLEKEYVCRLTDANDQSYTQRFIYAAEHHPVPVNVINLFTDPDCYVISAARMKTHNAVVGTFSLKNVAMGAPVCHWRKTGDEKINEKSKMHGVKASNGGRELSYNLFLLAQLGAHPDLAVIDGVETIEGDGPWGGETVEHGVAVVSTDFVAADRLCSELMGIDPKWMRYLDWCGQAGMGNFDLADIEVKGSDFRKHIIKYKLNKNFDWQVAWLRDEEK